MRCCRSLRGGDLGAWYILDVISGKYRPLKAAGLVSVAVRSKVQRTEGGQFIAQIFTGSTHMLLLSSVYWCLSLVGCNTVS